MSAKTNRLNSKDKLKPNSKQEHEKTKKLADFSEEYNGRLAKILVLNQPMLIGKIVEARRYWIKVETADNKILYINKAYIISIEPVGVKP
jgi:hypothetical protein